MPVVSCHNVSPDGGVSSSVSEIYRQLDCCSCCSSTPNNQFFFAIVFEKEAVYLHWELVCNNRTGDQLEQGLLLFRLLGAWLGKSRQVGGYGRSWSTAYWELGWASLGNSVATVNLDRVRFSTSASREAPVDILIYRLLGAGLGKSRHVGGDGRS